MATKKKSNKGKRTGKVEKAAKKDKKTEKAEKKEKKRTIAMLVRELFEDDPAISTQDMIDAVLEEFPNSKFKGTHVAYYRSKYRDDYEIPIIKKAKKDDDDDDEDDDE